MRRWLESSSVKQAKTDMKQTASRWVISTANLWLVFTRKMTIFQKPSSGREAPLSIRWQHGLQQVHNLSQIFSLGQRLDARKNELSRHADMFHALCQKALLQCSDFSFQFMPQLCICQILL